MKKINYKIITFFTFFFLFFACAINVDAAAIDKDTVYSVGGVNPICGVKLDNNVGIMGGVYFSGNNAIISNFKDPGNDPYVNIYIYDISNTGNSKTCTLKASNTTKIPGNGNDITFSSVSSNYYIINGKNNIIKSFTYNNSKKITVSKTDITGADTYLGIAHDKARKRFYIVKNSDKALYYTPDLNGNISKPTKLSSINLTSNNNKKLTVNGLAYSNDNIYVITIEEASTAGYILVYDANFTPTNTNDSGYKYSIYIPSKMVPAILKGATVQDKKMLLGYNNYGTKANEFYEIPDLNVFENQYGNKITNVELISNNQITLVEGAPFDYSDLYVRITHRNGSKEEIPLNEGNCSVTGFDSHSLGEQIVTINYAGGWSFQLKINIVRELVPVSGVSINKKSVTVKVGDEIKVSNTITPKDATNKKVTWTSADKNIATVSSNGKIKGINPGITTVTVTTQEGGYTASVEVNVVTEDVPEVIRAELDVREPIVITKYSEFDFSNLYIIKTYSDGGTEEIKLNSENCTIEGFDNETTGAQTITFIFEDYTFHYDILVKELEQIPEDEQSKKVEPKPLNVIATKEKSTVAIVALTIIISLISIGVLLLYLVKNGIIFKK